MLSRRSFIRNGGLLTAAGLSGCLGNGSNSNSDPSSDSNSGSSWIRELDIDAPDSVYQRIRDGVTVRDNGQVEVSPADLLEYGQLVDESDPWRVYPPQTENSIMENEKGSTFTLQTSSAAGPNRLDEFTLGGAFYTLTEEGNLSRVNPQEVPENESDLKTVPAAYRTSDMKNLREGGILYGKDGPMFDIGPTIGDTDLPEGFLAPLFYENDNGDYNAVYLAFLDTDYQKHIAEIEDHAGGFNEFCWARFYREGGTYADQFSPTQITNHVVADAYVQENIGDTLTGTHSISGFGEGFHREGIGLGYSSPPSEGSQHARRVFLAMASG